MHTTGTHIAYLHLCHRKRWLFANGMQMEHRSELVAEGRQADLRNLEDFVNLASPSAKPPPPPPAKRNREQAPEVTNVHW
jgi:CRISPR/Cas system-associated exonuclease Cas4 (RecB family)